MNLFELLFVMGSVCGAMVAATFVEPGLLLLALPLGLFAGGVLTLSLLLAVGFLSETWAEYQTDRSLQVHFGPFQSKNAEWLWEDVEQHVPAGQVLRGRVATRLDGDLYVDIGLGFPARLRPWHARDRALFDSLWGGDVLEARVVGLDGERRIIELTQR